MRYVITPSSMSVSGPQRHRLARAAQQHVDGVVSQAQLDLEQPAGLVRLRRQHREEGGLPDVLLQLRHAAPRARTRPATETVLLEHLLQALAPPALDTSPVGAHAGQHPLEVLHQLRVALADLLEAGEDETASTPGPALGEGRALMSIIVCSGDFPVVPRTHPRSSVLKSSSVSPRAAERAPAAPRPCSSIILRTSLSEPENTAEIFPFVRRHLHRQPGQHVCPSGRSGTRSCPTALVPTRTCSTIFCASSLATLRSRSEPLVSFGLATDIGAISAGLKRKPGLAGAAPSLRVLLAAPPAGRRPCRRRP